MKNIARVNLSHIRENAKALWESIGKDKFFCPMVKANAYGHGAVEISKTLESTGVRNFGVVTIEEGLELRTHLLAESKILIFSTFNENDLEICSVRNLTPVVSDNQTLEAIERFQGSLAGGLHLKFNTGMNRQGFDLTEIDRVRSFFESHPEWQVHGICTHFANAEDIEDTSGVSASQLKKFKEVQEAFGPGYAYHLLNSASLLQNHKLEFGARPGLSIYGVSPITNQRQDINLRPAMSLHSHVANLRQIGPGDAVSYGGTWTAKTKAVIALIPIGYADGLRRALSGEIHFGWQGELVPQVGRVCMDYCLADVTKVADKIEVGDTIDIFGGAVRNDLSVARLAKICETIPYEIFTGIGSRVVREFYDS